MKGIECAYFGSLARDAELKTAKSGKPWASLLVMVDTGEEKAQLVQTAVFGETAEKLDGAPKGTRVYCEGTLKTSTWNAADGEVKHGLSCAAFKCERVGSSAIGRNRPPRERGQEYTAAGSNRESPAYCAGSAARERPGIVGRDDFEQTGGDRMPF